MTRSANEWHFDISKEILSSQFREVHKVLASWNGILVSYHKNTYIFGVCLKTCQSYM